MLKKLKGKVGNNKYELIGDKFKTYEQLDNALRVAGLEDCNLIIGVDFTKSNTWQGGLPFYGNKNLHSMNPYPNPYQRVLQIMCRALENFDEDNKIPAYGFGDSVTKDSNVFPLTGDSSFTSKDTPCWKLDGVLDAYNQTLMKFESGQMTMSGGTSFAPIIRKAIEIASEARSYHILIIIADGAVDKEKDTIEAIKEASEYPLSIITIGVGKGPWDVMEKFDDKVKGRKFDNFQFVDFHKIMSECENEEVEFAKHALMEVPMQLKYIKKHMFI